MPRESDRALAARNAQAPPTQIDLNSSLISWEPSHSRGTRGPSASAAESRRRIRAHASRSSAVQRKATIASRAQQQKQQVQQVQQATPPSTPDEVGQTAISQAQRLHAALVQSNLASVHSASAHYVDFQEFVSVVEGLESQKNWLNRALRETTLAQTSIRRDMRGAMTISPALFQATLFISGTFSNTCGLSYADVKLGVGMAFMRGASLEAVRSAITGAEGEHWISLAVALLAGWELRFGDRESYAIHMGAYRQMFGCPLALEENSTARMRDFAWETLREQLNDLTISAPMRSSRPSQFWRTPQGFDVFAPAVAPEVKSLLSIIRDLIAFDPEPLENLPRIRNLGLMTMSWSPHHGESFEPSETFEGHWDPAELIALLHVRAAVLSIVAINSHICHTRHWAKSYLDIMGAADVHAYSCGHLRTDALIGTKYQYAAVWARFAIASVSRDPSRDAWLVQWLKATNIRTWESLRALMSQHILRDEFETQARILFDAISHELSE